MRAPLRTDFSPYISWAAWPFFQPEPHRPQPCSAEVRMPRGSLHFQPSSSWPFGKAVTPSLIFFNYYYFYCWPNSRSLKMFLLTLHTSSKANIWIALCPDRLHVPQQGLLDTGGRRDSVCHHRSPFASPAPGRWHRTTSTSLCCSDPPTEPGTPRSCAQQPRRAKELKQAHC